MAVMEDGSATLQHAGATDRVRVLLATTVLTADPRTGGEVASDRFKQALRRTGADVVELGFVRAGDTAPVGVRVVGRRPIESVTSRRRAALWMASAMITGTPYSSAKYRSARWWSELADAGRADVAIIDHAQLGFLLPALRLLAPRVVLCAHNVEHELYAAAAGSASRLARAAYARESKLMRRTERDLVAGVDEVWALTPTDAAALRALVPGSATTVRVAPLPGAICGEEGAGAEQARSRNVRVLGTWSWPFNREGMRWLLQEVVPLLPDDVVVEIGGAGGAWIPTGPQVRYVGVVPDAFAFLRGAAAIAIPTQSGGGIEIKTLDALSTGVPVVGTPTAFRGIDELPGHARAVAPPAAFAAALVADRDAPARPEAAIAWSRGRSARFDAVVAAGLERAEAPVAAR